MREIKKDDRAIERMRQLKLGYAQLAERLKLQGLDLSTRTVFKYMTHRDTPNKSVKKEIARALDCLVSDIF